MCAGTVQGDEGMRVGKQSRAPALPWVSGQIKTREQPRGTGGSCTSPSPYRVVDGKAPDFYYFSRRKQEDAPEAGC